MIRTRKRKPPRGRADAYRQHAVALAPQVRVLLAPTQQVAVPFSAVCRQVPHVELAARVLVLAVTSARHLALQLDGRQPRVFEIPPNARLQRLQLAVWYVVLVLQLRDHLLSLLVAALQQQLLRLQRVQQREDRAAWLGTTCTKRGRRGGEESNVSSAARQEGVGGHALTSHRGDDDH